MVRGASILVAAVAPLACCLWGLPSCSEHFPAVLTSATATGDAGAAGVEAGGPSNAPRFTVTTMTPASSLGPPEATSATWAAYRREDGTWVSFSESTVGTYTFQTSADRWAVVFACADAESSLVAMYEDVAANKSATIQLETWCGKRRPDPVTVSGTLTNLADDSGWLDFGYPLEERGAVLPRSGGRSADYEEVNVAPGTWDMAFGVRPEAGVALSKIAFVRAQPVTKDAIIDVDVGGGVQPGSQPLAIAGYAPDRETIDVPVYYALSGGPRGIDLGPSVVPAGPALELSYSTVPAAAQAPSDRYRAEVSTRANDDSASRGFVAVFHDAVPLSFTLAEPLAVPAVTVAATAPYARVAAKVAVRPAAAVYELVATAKPSNRASRVWRVATAAALVTKEETFVLPDLSAVADFDAQWTLAPELQRQVTVTVRETPTTLGDGTVTHFVSHTTLLEPPAQP